MKALRKLAPGPGNLEVVEIPAPAPGPGEVLLKVAGAGICGTDLHIRHGRFAKARPPVTLGHEFAGEVVELGAGVTNPSIGAKVTVETEAHSCGACPHCQTGETNLCQERLAYGYSTDGGFAEFVKVRAAACHLLPAHVSPAEGALGEPLAVGVHAALEVGRAAAGETVLVTGAGPIGICCAIAAQAVGARVVLAGLAADAGRLQAARAAGIANTVASDREDLEAALRQVSKHGLADLAVECAAAPPAVADCLRLLRPQGRLVQVGLFNQTPAVDLNTVALKELSILGSFAHHPETWRAAIRIWGEKKLNLKPLVSGAHPLDDWQTPFDLSEQGQGVKYLLHA